MLRCLNVSVSQFTCLGAGLAILISATAPTKALAADPKSAPFDPSLETSVVSYPYDSDWVPANSPLQFRLQAAFLDEVRASMQGDATYDWDDETLVFEGEPSGGDFEYEIGVELTTSVQIDIAGIIIPADVIGPLDIKLPTSASYDPYLLPGNPDRPADGSTSFTVNAIDQDLNFGAAATGNISIDIQVDFIGLSFQSNSLDVLESEVGEPVLVSTQEGELLEYSLAAPVDPDTADIWGLLHSEMNAETSIHFLPSVSVTPMGGAPITIGPFDLDVNFPVVNEQPLDFGAELIPFEGPTPDPTPGESGDESGGDDGDTGESDTTGSQDDGGDTSESSTNDGSEESSEGNADGEVGGGDGCDCRADQRGTTPGTLALFGILAWRRRR